MGCARRGKAPVGEPALRPAWYAVSLYCYSMMILPKIVTLIRDPHALSVVQGNPKIIEIDVEMLVDS